jgi:hypothetical protein
MLTAFALSCNEDSLEAYESISPYAPSSHTVQYHLDKWKTFILHQLGCIVAWDWLRDADKGPFKVGNPPSAQLSYQQIHSWNSLNAAGLGSSSSAHIQRYPFCHGNLIPR